MLRRATAIAALLLASAHLVAVAEGPAKYVVLVSVDGLSASYLEDPRADMPNLRAIASQGVSARGMLTVLPSVTWPSHTSLATGTFPAKHGVVGNSSWNRETNKQVTYIGDPVLTKQQAIRVPTLYDVAHQAGLSTASVIWPCSNGAKTLDWVIPDSNKPELHAQYTTPGFVEELSDAGIDISKLGEWGWGKQYSTQRDILYTQVTKHLLSQHKVNLILLHLVTPDGVEHAYGPNTPAAYQSVAESDQRLGEVWAALQEPPFAGQSALFVVSDHGFAPYEQTIQPNVVLKDLGLVAVGNKDEVERRDAWCIAQGGSAFVYVLDESRRDELTDRLEKDFNEVAAIQSVLRPEQFTKLGVPDPADNPEAPHLMLMTGPGFSFTNNVTGPVVSEVGSHRGAHGHDPRPDFMHAMFVAAGAGLANGKQLDVIKNVDIAPTIAHLLGLEFPCDGRILTEALAP